MLYVVEVWRKGVCGYSQVSQTYPWTKMTTDITKAKKYKQKGSAMNRAKGLRMIFNEKNGFEVKVREVKD